MFLLVYLLFCHIGYTHASRFRIIVLTCDRAASLYRLLHSLEVAFYDGYTVDMDVWIDRLPSNIVDPEVIKVSRRFKEKWQNGEMMIHVWKTQVGIRRQWIDTWFLSAGQNTSRQRKERAIILEDDMSVSKFYFRWLLLAHTKYEHNNLIQSFTLQRATLCAAQCPDLSGGPGANDKLSSFGYPLVGSWGFSPKAGHWIDFRQWFKTFTGKPYVSDLTPTLWYQSMEGVGKESTMWTMHHIYYVNLKKQIFTLYAKCPFGSTLASNHKEKGLHFKSAGGEDFPVVEKVIPNENMFMKSLLEWRNASVDTDTRYIGWDAMPLAPDVIVIQRVRR